MNYTSSNKAPTQMAQAPNRKGNVSKSQPDPKNSTGVTAVTGSNKHKVSQPSGAQGAAKATGVIHGCCKNPVFVSRPKSNYGANDGYRSGSSYKS